VAQLPDGGFALSGLQKRAFSDTGAVFICNTAAMGFHVGLVEWFRSLEIGEFH